MSENVRAAVFASGSGSNFEAIMKKKDLACEVVLLICDQEGAKVIERARRRGIRVFVIDRQNYSSKEIFEEAITNALTHAKVEWIFLAGYMRIVGPTLLRGYQGKIVNIHPSLLPAFPGIDAIDQAFEAKVAETGVTVHFIDEGIDTGPIIAQEKVAILPEDTRESLQRRIQKIEHKLYPKVINQLINGGYTS